MRSRFILLCSALFIISIFVFGIFALAGNWTANAATADILPRVVVDNLRLSVVQVNGVADSSGEKIDENYTAPKSVGGGTIPLDKINEPTTNATVNTNEISGVFEVLNYENYYMPDLYYKIRLFKGTSFETFQLIDTRVSDDTISVSPANVNEADKSIQPETAIKLFKYSYPNNIIEGEYTLMIQIVTGRGMELGWKTTPLHLRGNNKFLDIITSKVTSGGKDVLPLQGIIVAPTDDVFTTFNVENKGEEITATPNIKIYQRDSTMPVVNEYNDQPTTFKKGEIKEIKLLLPKFQTPESYLAEIKFKQGGEVVSGINYARWVVEGGNGKVIYIKTDKDYFRAGENINLTVENVGPADMTDLGQGTLEVVITDQQGNFIGKALNDVPLNFNTFSSKISIPVKSDLVSPKIDVKLTKNGKILDERNVSLPVFSFVAKSMQETINAQQEIENKNKAEKNKKNEKYLDYILLVSIAIIFAAVIFFIYKFYQHKSKNKNE